MEAFFKIETFKRHRKVMETFSSVKKFKTVMVSFFCIKNFTGRMNVMESFLSIHNFKSCKKVTESFFQYQKL